MGGGGASSAPLLASRPPHARHNPTTPQPHLWGLCGVGTRGGGVRRHPHLTRPLRRWGKLAGGSPEAGVEGGGWWPRRRASGLCRARGGEVQDWMTTSPPPPPLPSPPTSPAPPPQQGVCVSGWDIAPAGGWRRPRWRPPPPGHTPPRKWHTPPLPPPPTPPSASLGGMGGGGQSRVASFH